MKKTISKTLLLALLMVCFGFTSAYAQPSTTKTPRYKDFVGENPNADADIKFVSDYVDRLVAGEVDKAVSMLASNYKAFGPSINDSADAKMIAESWKHNDSVQTNRKADYVVATFIVKQGELAGHWVEMWGTYSFTENGKEVRFPYQYSAHLKDGKIDRDYIYYDRLSILEALGYTITPPAK
jgi:ketosteroid isomerase-like protein